ncbi:DUF5711 family protein [Coprococcus catus]|jgi:hypothetical protein|uniref:DUF5711 family protein n=1 Tax=Coprococcus catus TaxID=116085 RepID=UPI001C8B6215|nr:DUF5711 family protein [Coprococcus catus]MBX9229860.1 hypothetical protein [Coprococcus catus]MCT6800029.1 hypothetical protein [Coprococcus catus]
MEQQIDEKKKQKIKLNRMQWTIIIGLLVMVGVLVYALVKNNRVSGSYEVVTSLSRGDDTSVYYQIMRKGMIRYSKDGMAMTDKSGNLIWTQTYEMTSPAIAVSDPYVAVGDIGANTIYIFNEYGQLGRINTDVPIQEIRISAQGVIAAVLSDSATNYINLYDKQGNVLGSIKASLQNTGYPLAIALSSDATRLLASYLCMDGSTVKTRVISYNFSDTQSKHVIDTLELEELYPKIEFLENNKAVMFGEKSFVLYNTDTKEITAQQTFENEIASVFCSDQKIGFIFKASDENGQYYMEIYNKAGRKNSSVYFDFDYEGINVYDDEVILYNSQEMAVYQMNGRLKFTSTLNTSVTNIMASWESGMYWLVDDQSLREIHIK